MQRVTLLCVGRLKEAHWRNACAEYAKRLSAFCRFSIVELPESRLPDRPSQAQIDAALKEEGQRIFTAAGTDFLTALCVEGTALSSPELARRLEDTAVRGAGSLAFAIGSSFGLCDSVKRAAGLRLSMSAMTFPHQLARVMLCEQIYRAFQINTNGKYHK